MNVCPKCERGGTGPHPAFCTPEMRFWHKVKIVGACWEWQGASHPHGYGQMRLNDRRLVFTHRWMHEQVWGAIPEGMVVMHSCDNPRCVRPVHLSAGTPLENVQDCWRKGRGSSGKADERRQRTHCLHGHEYTDENTRYDSDGHRICRECGNAQRRIPNGRGAYNRRKSA